MFARETMKLRQNLHEEDLSKIFKLYRPRINLNIDSGTYKLTTAQTAEELLEVFKMRQDIFAPKKVGKEKAIYEYDEFDAHADHMIITHKESATICGTYRILCSENVSNFYSQTEFDMTAFFAQEDGIKLEFGRACVLPEYRSGAIIALLWRGLAHYIDKSKARFLFGCSSVDTIDKMEISQIYQYVKDHFYSEDYNIKTLPKFHCPIEENVSYEIKNIKSLIPPLLRTYQACGALVYGPPALDQESSSIDFLTILNMDTINQAFWNRFFR